MRVDVIPGVEALSTPEKILLVEELWNRIAADETRVSVPDSHRDELDARLAGYRHEPGELLTLAELQQRVQARR